MANRINYFEPNDIFSEEYGLNPLNSRANIPVKQEDLNMYVNLKVKVPSRFKGAISQYDSIFSGSRIMAKGTNGYNEEYNLLTTSYVNVGYTEENNKSDFTHKGELFGIKSINISFDSQFFPQVTIEFSDVRGDAIMAPAEVEYTEKSDDMSLTARHFFNSVFSFPYPIFTLEVKGYYGTPIAFDMAVSNFKSSFDTTTGNFDVTIDFIGYLYGMYTDIPTSYILMAPYFDVTNAISLNLNNDYSSVQGSYWIGKNFTFDDGGKIPTFLELLSKHLKLEQGLSTEEMEVVTTKINSIEGTDYEAFSSYANAGEKVVILENFKNELELFIDSVYEKCFKGEERSYGRDDYYLVCLNKKEITTNISSVYTGKVNEALSKLKSEDEIFKYLNTYIDETDNIIKIKNTIDCNFGGVQIPSSWIEFYEENGEKKYKIKENDNSLYKGFLSSNNSNQYKENMEKYTDTNHLREGDSPSYLYVYPLTKDGKSYSDLINYIDSQIQELNSSINAKEEESMKYANEIGHEMIGFKPTIKNVYKTCYAYMDTFFHHLNETVKACRNRQQERRYNQSANAAYKVDFPDGPIPPFPLFAKKNAKTNIYETVYLGDIPSYANEPEVKLVENIYNNIKQLQPVIRSLKQLIQESENKIVEDEEKPFFVKGDFIPLLPLDLKYGNPYINYFETLKDSANSVIDKEKIANLFSLMGARYITFREIYNPEEREKMLKADDIGKIEAINFFKAAKGSFDFKELISSLKVINDVGIIDNGRTTQKGFFEIITNGKYDGITVIKDEPITFMDLFLYNMKHPHNEIPIYYDSVESILDIKNTYDTPKTKENNWTNSKYENEDEDIYYDEFIVMPFYQLNKEIQETREVVESAGLSRVEQYKNIFRCDTLSVKADGWNKMGDGFRRYLTLEDGNNISFLTSSSKDETFIQNMGWTICKDYFKDNPTEEDKILSAFFFLQSITCSIKEGIEEGSKSGLYGIVKVNNVIDESLINILALGGLIYVAEEVERFDNSLTPNGSYGNYIVKNIITVDKDSRGAPYYLKMHKNYDVENYKLDISNKYLVTLPPNTIAGLQQPFLTENFRVKSIEDFIKYTRNYATEHEIYNTLFVKEMYFSRSDDFSFGRVSATWNSYYKKYNLDLAPRTKHNLKKMFKEWVMSNEDTIPWFNVGDGGWAPNDFDAEIPTFKKIMTMVKDVFGREKSNYGKAILSEDVKKIVNQIFDTKVILIKTPVYNNTGRGPTYNSDVLNLYFSSFYSTLKSLALGSDFEEAEQIKSEIKERREIKTNIYYTLKNIYDKWFSDEFNNKFILNGGDSEFSKLEFTDAYFNDIGETLMANFKSFTMRLYNTLSGSSPSIYETMNDIAQDNSCLFLPVPFTNSDGLKEVFTPHSMYNGKTIKSNTGKYIVMHHGDVSHFLGNDNETKSDSFVFNENGKTVNETAELFSNTVGKTVEVFGVTYAKQNQNFFTSINVNMDSPSVTDYSIANTLDLVAGAANGDVTTPVFMNKSLYPIYANRSYNCDVEMMGCANIAPLTYFQLNNIPMFKGAYLITNVSHTITPGKFITKFTGVRMSRYSSPINKNIFTIDDINNKLSMGNSNEDFTVFMEYGDITYDSLTSIKYSNNKPVITFNNSKEIIDKYTKPPIKKFLQDLANYLIENNNENEDLQILVTSTYRSNSSTMHKEGKAVDMQELTNRYRTIELFKKITSFFIEKEYPFYQLIWETNQDSTRSDQKINNTQKDDLNNIHVGIKGDMLDKTQTQCFQSFVRKNSMELPSGKPFGEFKTSNDPTTTMTVPSGTWGNMIFYNDIVFTKDKNNENNVIISTICERYEDIKVRFRINGEDEVREITMPSGKTECGYYHGTAVTEIKLEPFDDNFYRDDENFYGTYVDLKSERKILNIYRIVKESASREQLERVLHPTFIKEYEKMKNAGMIKVAYYPNL